MKPAALSSAGCGLELTPQSLLDQRPITTSSAVHDMEAVLTVQARVESCHPPLVDEDILLGAAQVYDDTCYVLKR